MVNVKPSSYVKSGIFSFSITQVTAWLSHEYLKINNKPITYKFIGNKNHMRQFQASIPTDDENKPRYVNPYIMAVVASMSLDIERNALKKNRISEGLITGKDLTTATGYRENLRGVKVGLGFNFRSDSMDDVIDLAHILLMHAPKKGFVMEGDHGFTVETSISIDPDITLSESESTESGEYYSYDFTIMLNTYIGFAEEVRLIKSIRFNTLEKPNDPFFEGDPYFDLTQTINYTDYLNRSNPNYRGYKFTNDTGL